jgi:hypothetical protein
MGTFDSFQECPRPLKFCSHDAQKCYCGEPNCVGFIGGKTQTDLGGMDDLYIDGAPPLTMKAAY